MRYAGYIVLFVCCMSANSPPATGLRSVSFSPMEALAVLGWSYKAGIGICCFWGGKCERRS
jgi:hypothetical protein